MAQTQWDSFQELKEFFYETAVSGSLNFTSAVYRHNRDGRVRLPPTPAIAKLGSIPLIFEP